MNSKNSTNSSSNSCNLFFQCPYKGEITFVMHPEIEAALVNTSYQYPALTAITLRNAEKLMNYIDDINLDRPEKFVPTPAQSLYILWSVEDWEFHMECIKTGSILYTFRKGGHEEASGNYTVDEFIPQLERYLLMGIA